MEREPKQPKRDPSPDPKVVRPPGTLPAQNPSSGPHNADKLTTLAHDLSNMIDGSMRWLSLAIAALPNDQKDDAPSDPEGQIGGVREQVETVQTMLERMSTMVNAALRSGDVPIGSPILGVMPSVPLGVAIDHAVDAVAPLSSSVGAEVRVSIDQAAGGVPAGPLYTVVLNGLFNAVQSIERGEGAHAGSDRPVVEISASYDEGRDELLIEISDEGPGVEKGIREFAFEPGVSCEPDRSGIGLAMSRQIIEQLEGVIDLNNRPDMRGAVLSVRVPVPEDETEREIG